MLSPGLAVGPFPSPTPSPEESGSSLVIKLELIMFTKILAKLTKSPAPEPVKTHAEMVDDALQNALREREHTNPMAGAQVGAKEIYQQLLGGMADEKGVHTESLLCALGALAGYACQASLRAQAVAANMAETAAFQVVKTTDGKQYFFGDPLNNLLANSQFSVWALAGGAAQHNGATVLPDLHEIFEHTASTVGDDGFGIPRVPENHSACDLPINFLKIIWPELFPTIKRFCPDPAGWPVLYGFAIQEAMDASKAVIDPATALKIVMESAVPMSKVDLPSLAASLQPH